MSLKLFIFGIDGASYTIVKKLIAKGLLPNLATIAGQGVSGELKSTFPPHTAPGWASMFTGAEPGEHGIFQFWHTQNPDYIPKMTNVYDFNREPIWHTLERHGLHVGVINVPMTHPPQTLQGGYMISWPLSTTIHYSEPRSLIRDLANAGLHYHSDIVTMYRGQENYLDLASSYIEGRTQTILYLLKNRPVDALFVVYTEIDRISHHYWGINEKASVDVLNFYTKIDHALGQLMENFSEDTLIIVASDHGFGLCRYNLNINSLLINNGLASIKLIPSQQEYSVKSSDDLIDNKINSWFQSTQLYYRAIDWPKTYAYMPTPGCFGINLNCKGREREGIVSPDQKKYVIRDLCSLFKELRDPDKNPVFELVPSSKIYKGSRANTAPDFLLIPYKWDVMPHPTIELDIWGKPIQQAIHRLDGILFAKGKNIPKGVNINARIEDVTPLVLAQLGLPVSENITGHWLFDPHIPIRREAPCALSNQKSRSLSLEEEILLKKRLNSLGYL